MIVRQSVEHYKNEFGRILEELTVENPSETEKLYKQLQEAKQVKFYSAHQRLEQFKQTAAGMQALLDKTDREIFNY